MPKVPLSVDSRPHEQQMQGVIVSTENGDSSHDSFCDSEGDASRDSSRDASGDPSTVEVAALVSMLSSVDGTHRALGAELEPLPNPAAGDPTGEIAQGLKRRRTHLPVPPGAIPVMFDLLPYEGAVYQSLFGPQYMTGREMALDTFRRSPGLDRAQMELVSSRTSIHNECFY